MLSWFVSMFLLAVRKDQPKQFMAGTSQTEQRSDFQLQNFRMQGILNLLVPEYAGETHVNVQK
jgi:GDP-D-mannose dehydratase